MKKTWLRQKSYVLTILNVLKWSNHHERLKNVKNWFWTNGKVWDCAVWPTCNSLKRMRLMRVLSKKYQAIPYFTTKEKKISFTYVVFQFQSYTSWTRHVLKMTSRAWHELHFVTNFVVKFVTIIPISLAVWQILEYNRKTTFCNSEQHFELSFSVSMVFSKNFSEWHHFQNILSPWWNADQDEDRYLNQFAICSRYSSIFAYYPMLSQIRNIKEMQFPQVTWLHSQLQIQRG